MVDAERAGAALGADVGACLVVSVAGVADDDDGVFDAGGAAGGRLLLENIHNSLWIPHA